MSASFLLYGANGYTGQLIAHLAVEKGLRPVLAGRNRTAIEDLAGELDLPYAVFDLSDTPALDQQLKEVPVVLHAAGPFVHTARPMLEACLRTQTHYLDITGEIPVFERAASLGKRATDAGITLLPGSGFDVVPTDCLALHLQQQLPDASHLQLAFATKGSRLSRGTALTMAENLGNPGAVRQQGRIKAVPLGHKAMQVPFAPDMNWLAMTIPWGDVSTAYYSTGIPNIETYTSVPPKTYQRLQWQKYFNWLLRLQPVRQFVKSRIKSRQPGPSAAQREQGRSYVWGRVENPSGDSRTAHLEVSEGYRLTAMTSVAITQRVLAGGAPIGFQTPAKAFGADFILEVDGSARRE